MNAPFSSAGYWEARYRAGGHSGAGSQGRLLAYKAAVINGFIAANRIGSIMDFGCGDGRLLSLLEAENYTGVDVSVAALAACAAQFPRHRFLEFAQIGQTDSAELTLSIDVIYHLVEDSAFLGYLERLFGCASRFVLIYASNADQAWPAAHVRHRRFTDSVAARHPGWRLLAHMPNRHPFDPARPDDTSFADFYLFGRPDAPCRLALPG